MDGGRKTGGDSDGNYTVVARRYRPKSFGELVGQDNISHALGKAITTGRVGHAYLFTGARGVGKTSTARIFAKALNAPEGSTLSPDNTSDVCQAIDAGEDLDVIEIDGASNRSIEDVRQLRANINVRPSRSRYKIYIIDEVHMLTTPAFNALLKTLEEPPEHVKFIFCTTDADKIPITVLSRCQRFDFAPVSVPSIQQRLQEICALEGFDADEEALALLARRAAGSMRDSQSLLEQVISFSSGRITVDQVYALLGLADEGRLLELVGALRNHSSVQAIRLVDDAINRGSDAGQLAEQVLSYLRDLMAVAVGGGAELLKLANPSGFANLKSLADGWGLQTILAAIQILDEALARMRYSVQSRTLLELALVQICQLQHLTSLASLMEAVRQNGAFGAIAVKPIAPVSAEKKNGNSEAATTPRLTERIPTVDSISGTRLPASAVHEPLPQSDRDELSGGIAEGTASAALTPLEQWRKAVAKIDGMLADFAFLANEIEVVGSNQWVVKFPAGGQKSVEYCESADNRRLLLSSLRSLVGRDIGLTFQAKAGPIVRPTETARSGTAERSQRIRQVAEHPLVEKICKLLDGEIVRVDPPQKLEDSVACRHLPVGEVVGSKEG